MKSAIRERAIAKPRSGPLKIVSIYVLAGALWILTSDLILSWFSAQPSVLTRFQTLKGWLFIGLTGALLYLLFHKHVGEVRRWEEALLKASRALKTLSSCNQILVKAREEPELLEQVCRAIVEVGGYRMAWVGYAERDEGKSIRPVAQWGYEQGYLDTLDISWADGERGRGPTGTAVRTGEPVVVQDILGDKDFEPWRAEAAERGYASTVALPLKEGNRPIGALRVYAAEPDAFDQEELALLKEMASDLAYGINSIRTRTKRKQAEEETRLLQRIALEVSVAKDFHSALSVVLRLVCEATGWAYGEAWIPRADDAALECNKAWHSKRSGLEKFRELSEGLSFSPGEGVPGRAFASKKPVWVSDVTSASVGFKRKEASAELGFKASSAIPVLAEDEVVAVMVFFLVEESKKDQNFIRLVSTVAAQLGSLVRRKQAEEELRRAHEKLQQAYETLERAQSTAIASEKLASLGRLTAGVSHEIRNPLNVISMYIHMMLQDPDIEPERASELEDVMEQARRIEKITNDLLYVARHRSPERRMLDLNEEAKRVFGLLERELRLQNVEVELKLQDGLPQVSADQDQLQQVVFNLLSNARDAMPEGGRLSLATGVANTENGEVVELRVEDTGPGIPREVMNKLFEPFFTTKPEGEGTGLGLSICHGIVQAHGGSIRAEKAEDGGAAFVVRLPAGQASGAGHRPGAAS